ncbi:DUF547 domain-containing protein [Elusimicrobiota bacterium]
MFKSGMRTVYVFIFFLYFSVSNGYSFMDYKDYGFVLDKYVTSSGSVDYDGLSKNRRELDIFIKDAADLKESEFKEWDEQERIAFWINIYNALTLKTVVDNYPLKSIKDIGSVFKSVWDKLEFTVIGKEMTLNHIEHGILRKDFNEPSIHMAINCASKSCPTLLGVPYSGRELDVQFDLQSRKFLSNTGNFNVDRNKNIVYLSSIFKWFGGDFVKKYSPQKIIKDLDEKQSAVINFIVLHTGADDEEYLLAGGYKIKYLYYNWSLNDTGIKMRDR